jgi:hypothetical protein
MAEQAATPCPGCQRLQEQLDATRGQIEALQAAVARLQEQLASARKDSSTSSKPPSSDIVKPPPPPPPPGQAKRSIGGQPGHPKHERALFGHEQIDHFFDHPLSGCPCCGGPLRRNGGLALVVQQVDVEPAKLTVEQHTCPEYWCVHCERAYKAVLPQHIVTGGLVGPRLTTLIAYLKGFCHASFSTIRLFLRDVAQVTISRGQLRKNRRPRFEYEYDFGDGWKHQLIVEERLQPEQGTKYPVCIAGQRACPPEDCGGPWSYSDFVETITNPDHERHEETLEWVGGEFDPERFDPEAVNNELRRLRTRKP